MNDDALRVEFKVNLGGRRPARKPAPGAKAARQRQDRAARKARNLALAYWIDGLVHSGEVPDLASVAGMCGVSRARVSKVMDMLGLEISEQEICLKIAPIGMVGPEPRRGRGPEALGHR